MLSSKEIQILKSLHQKKGRQQTGQFLVDNPKVISEQLKNPLLKKIYVTKDLAGSYQKAKAPLVLVTDQEMKKIAPSQTPQGALAIFDILSVAKFSFADKNILLLDGVQDPGNVGTIIRTADWFGIKSIFLGSACADLYNPKTIASTMGSIFHVNIYTELDLFNLALDLKKNKYKVVATALQEKKHNLPTGKVALIIGSEAHGVDKKLLKISDQLYQIPGLGQAESLNAAVAAGIAIYQLTNK